MKHILQFGPALNTTLPATIQCQRGYDDDSRAEELVNKGGGKGRQRVSRYVRVLMAERAYHARASSSPHSSTPLLPPLLSPACLALGDQSVVVHGKGVV
jgi:hypothetical protein